MTTLALTLIAKAAHFPNPASYLYLYGLNSAHGS